MSTKDGTLHLARREHAVVIEAKLTDGHHLRFPGHLTQLHAYLIRVGRSIMRMDSHACKNNARVSLCKSECGATGGQVTAWINHARYSPPYSGLNNDIAISRKAGSVDVCMAIDEQVVYPSQRFFLLTLLYLV
jgi:hypothetical protein